MLVTRAPMCYENHNFVVKQDSMLDRSMYFNISEDICSRNGWEAFQLHYIIRRKVFTLDSQESGNIVLYCRSNLKYFMKVN